MRIGKKKLDVVLSFGELKESKSSKFVRLEKEKKIGCSSKFCKVEKGYFIISKIISTHGIWKK